MGLPVANALLGKLGLGSPKLIFGVDFTKSNEWTGKYSSAKQSLHAVGGTPNPYCTTISIIGRTFAFLDKDNLIPCFGFGNATTEDKGVFSFHTDCSPCQGYEGALICYNSIVPHVVLAGPTSYAPVVDAAISVVEKSGGRFHVLVIITDGQVTRSVDASDEELSPQEKETINAIVNASLYPLSILVVGVGDGPWEGMNKFIDKIPARRFNNYEFVNFTDIMSKESTPSKKEIAFALAALKGIPNQKNTASELGLLGCVTGKAKMIYPRPPTVPYTNCPAFSVAESSSRSTATPDERNWLCPICWSKCKDMAFGCGHMTCKECDPELIRCPICRKPIDSRVRVYP
ncbi:unnamed protein product [Ilex paraguariensis]|uniref:RING-type domain-containing protein n=1 Tax=Ilex paraguariensis TaxID=185542 RepID=A0ABC8UKR8_9AQUA